LIFYTILAAIPLAALALFQNLPPIVGPLVLGGSFFAVYKLYKYAQPYLNTKIITDDEGITVFLAGQEERFSWNEVSLSGKFYFQKTGKPFLFLYNLGKDRIITIPHEYKDMAQLEKVFIEKTPYEIIPPGIDIREVIVDRFHRKETPQDTETREDNTQE